MDTTPWSKIMLSLTMQTVSLQERILCLIMTTPLVNAAISPQNDPYESSYCNFLDIGILSITISQICQNLSPIVPKLLSNPLDLEIFPVQSGNTDLRFSSIIVSTACTCATLPAIYFRKIVMFTQFACACMHVEYIIYPQDNCSFMLNHMPEHGSLPCMWDFHIQL